MEDSLREGNLKMVFSEVKFDGEPQLSWSVRFVADISLVL